jgi:hypothetical protein
VVWVAACRHAGCGWKLTLRVQRSADDLKQIHQIEHPGHRVTVVGVARSSGVILD